MEEQDTSKDTLKDDGVPEGMEEITCVTCNGSGIESNKSWYTPEIRCDDCWGSGTVIVPELKSYVK